MPTADKAAADDVKKLAGFDVNFFVPQKQTDLGKIKTSKPAPGFTMAQLLSVIATLGGDKNVKFLNVAGAAQELGAQANAVGVVSYPGAGPTSNIKVTTGGVDFYVFTQQ